MLSKDHYGVHELTPDAAGHMEDYMVIAPAHNTPYLSAIRQFQKLTPDAKLVGVFETAFHRTIPAERYMYGIPYEWYEKYGIRRLGYHGASHEYISDTVQKNTDLQEKPFPVIWVEAVLCVRLMMAGV